VLGEFVPQREADRFALMVFGSAAAQLVPPSFDREHLLFQLERLQPGVLGDLSAVGDALALGVRSVRHERLRPALIFIGDGDPANAGTVHPAEALAVAVAHDVAIHALQIGPGPTDEAWAASDVPGLDGDPQPRFEDIARRAADILASSAASTTPARSSRWSMGSNPRYARRHGNA
jgi:Ca-activated chloride channel homolog